jgi:hypothetical protein
MGICRRQRTPFLLLAFFGGGGLFVGLKWRAVMQRSEAAKKAGAKDVNYAVAPGRSGTPPNIPPSSAFADKLIAAGGGI